MTLLLVRHAHAGDRDRWEHDDLARPLSELGHAQAARLVGQLSDRRIDRIVSSPAVRCLETVEPLAAARDLKVEEDQRLYETTPTELVHELLWSLQGEAAVLCTHGDVVGAVVAELRLRGVDVGDDPRWEKGSTWALTVEGQQVTSAAYLAPPA